MVVQSLAAHQKRDKSNFGIRSNSQSLEYSGVVSYQTSESVWHNVLPNITIK
jgi:hypothetical protein